LFNLNYEKVQTIAMEFGAPVLALALPVFASAQVQPAPIPAPGNINKHQPDHKRLRNTPCTVINWISGYSLCLPSSSYSLPAFKYLTAGGDPEKVKSAGSTLLYAAVAVIVALDREGPSSHYLQLHRGGLGSTGC